MVGLVLLPDCCLGHCSMINFDSYIQQQATGLAAGETGHFYCPSCGAQHEQSLAITRRHGGGLVWVCHRASCGFKGHIRGSGHPAVVGLPSIPKKAHKPLEAVWDSPTEEEMEFLRNRYGMDPSYFLMDRKSNRYGFPILSPEWKRPVLGWTLRAFDGRKPKSLTYKLSESRELMDWHLRGGNPPVVFLVEDQISAMKINSLGYSSIALCGVHLNLARVREIKEYFSKVVILLDPDALSMALAHKKNFGVFFDYCEVGRLKADPKDTPIKELQEFLRIESERAETAGRNDSKPGNVAQDTELRPGLSVTTNPDCPRLH